MVFGGRERKNGDLLCYRGGIIWAGDRVRYHDGKISWVACLHRGGTMNPERHESARNGGN